MTNSPQLIISEKLDLVLTDFFIARKLKSFVNCFYKIHSFAKRNQSHIDVKLVYAIMAL